MRREKGNQMETEKILAMAVAVIAEETGTDAKRIQVRSFREVHGSCLEQYLAENRIAYHKYQLEDEKA